MIVATALTEVVIKLSNFAGVNLALTQEVLTLFGLEIGSLLGSRWRKASRTTIQADLGQNGSQNGQATPVTSQLHKAMFFYSTQEHNIATTVGRTARWAFVENAEVLDELLQIFTVHLYALFSPYLSTSWSSGQLV